MTINLTELRDEQLGTPESARGGRLIACNVCLPPSGDCTDTEMALGDAADDESSFTFDVEGLGDEALDPPKSLFVLGCSNGCATIYQPVLARGQGSMG